LEVVEGSDRTGRGMEAEAELEGLVEPLVLPLVWDWAGVEVPLTVDPLGRERFPLVSWMAKSMVRGCYAFCKWVEFLSVRETRSMKSIEWGSLVVVCVSRWELREGSDATHLIEMTSVFEIGSKVCIYTWCK